MKIKELEDACTRIDKLRDYDTVEELPRALLSYALDELPGLVDWVKRARELLEVEDGCACDGLHAPGPHCPLCDKILKLLAEVE